MKRLLAMVLICIFLCGFGSNSIHLEKASFQEEAIIDIDALTLEQKVGQMILAGIDGYDVDNDVEEIIKSYQVGSIILFSYNIDTCVQAAKLVSDLKLMNSGYIPLFIAVDEEGGSVSRMPEEVINLPSAYYYGMMDNEELCFQLGQVLAMRCSAIGANVNFAPVADIWSNSKNEVIGKRSFGKDADIVSRLMIKTAQGMISQGTIPVMKHFPGHGDTIIDSHYELPVVTKTLEELNAMELIPFQNGFTEGIPAVMVAHLLMREIDDAFPATLSSKVINGLLREEMGFQGVVFTDDISMGAIVNTFEIGEAAVLAIEAGCDVVLVCHDKNNVQRVYQALLEAVETGRISEERLDKSISRILALKEMYGLDNEPVPVPDIDYLNQRVNEVILFKVEHILICAGIILGTVVAIIVRIKFMKR